MINPFTLLTSPLEKGLAAAVALLLVTSASEALVIKYEMTSKTQCVSAVMATNAETKTVTTAIRNVDNATNQTLQSTVSSRISTDLAGLHDGKGLPSGSSLPGISASAPGTPSTADSTTPNSYTADQVSAEACLKAYDIAVGWQEWYTQTQMNWNNIENAKTSSRGNPSGAGLSTGLEDLHISFPRPVRLGVGVGQEDVGKEQPLRDQGGSRSTGNGSSDARGQL